LTVWPTLPFEFVLEKITWLVLAIAILQAVVGSQAIRYFLNNQTMFCHGMLSQSQDHSYIIKVHGQIYIPEINFLVFDATLPGYYYWI